MDSPEGIRVNESVSPKPQSIPLGLFQIFRKFAEIFTCQGAPPVSITPAAANFSTSFASVVDTGVNDPGGKLPSVTATPVTNNGNNYQTADNLK
jgi:hypothetical protein